MKQRTLTSKISGNCGYSIAAGKVLFFFRTGGRVVVQ